MYLNEELCENATLNSSQRVSSELKILTALSFFATGSYQRIVGESRHLSQKAISNYVAEVTQALVHPNIIKKYITFPGTAAEREVVKRGFYEKHGMPGVIGCIDGSHVRIYKPKSDIEHLYYCRKHYHSINVQMVCDSECRILAVNPRYGGSTHDAFIWEASRVNDAMQAIHREDQCWLLGDSGYPLRPWLMTPCANPVPGSAEANYNNIHCKTRVLIENTFGRLKNRWRCCLGHRLLHCKPEKCAEIITACCVLHNFALQFGIPDPADDPAAVQNFARPEVAEDIDGANDLLRGHAFRNRLIRQLI